MTDGAADLEWHSGQTIWVAHDDVGYTKATILEVDSKTKLSVRLDEFDEMTTVDLLKTEVETSLIDKNTLLKTEDLTLLPDLHRPSLLDALLQRFLKDEIYTYTGHILIAVNPFKSLELYSKRIMSQYTANAIKTDLKPHVYFTAKEAFRKMRETEGRNQSVLVSGESGAGKTVTTKIVLDYLTTVTDEKSDMSKKVIQSNPVLEAFGNAKTLRNDNSSRFGKYIQLAFSDRTMKVEGCYIDTYLLEKARVMNHAKGERNFHIFYELHQGLTEAEKQEIDYIHVEDCKITDAHNRRVRRNDISDKEQWEKTLQAMYTVGLVDEEISLLKRIVSAIMHFGELEFEEIPGNTDDAAKISEETAEHAESAAKLLEIPVSQVQFALCSRIITLGSGKTVTKVHNVEQAQEARNAIAMALYERMFLWLVWKTNKGMKSETSRVKERTVGKYKHAYTISVLDIFGFEVFTKNTFEQLFINYANEVLQQLFNEFVFKIEQQVYQSEGIDWRKISFPDNSICISLVEDKKGGILKILDDVCLMPKGTDQAFHSKVKKVCAKKFHVVSVDDNRQSMQHLFTIKHFAGDVEYSSESFCLKNKNELRQEQISCLRSSSNSVIRTLLPEDTGRASGAAKASYFDEVEAELAQLERRGATAKKAKKKLKKSTQRLQQATVGNNFKVELNFAIEKIKASELHFIRCIKPNDQNLSGDLDRKRVLEQLNYSGVLEAVRISRLGYSSRFFFEDFAKRFFILHPSGKRLNASKNTAYKGHCKDILEVNGLVKFDDYQVGHSQVFLKAEAFASLEALKRQKQAKSVLIIQRCMKVFLFKLTIKRRIQRRRAEREEIERRKAEAKNKEIEAAAAKQRQQEQALKAVNSRKAASLELESTFTKPKVEFDDSALEVISAAARTNRTYSRKASRARSRASKRSKGSRRSKSSKKRNRNMNAEEALQAAVQEYFSQILAKIQAADIDSLLAGDMPFLLGCVFCFAFLFFNATGVQIQAVFNFIFLVGLTVACAIFVAQMKLNSDRKRMERYEVRRRKTRSVYYDLEEDEINSTSFSLKRRSSRKSSSSKRRSKKRRRSGKKSKSGTLLVEKELSTAEVLSRNQTRRRAQSIQKSMSRAQKKRFTGLLSKKSTKEKSGSVSLKTTNSKYGGVAYNFPSEA